MLKYPTSDEHKIWAYIAVYYNILRSAYILQMY